MTDYPLTQLNALTLGQPHLPALLVLHGWSSNAALMRPFAQKLSRHYHVHVIDLPGFGESPKPDTDWHTTEFGECIHDYLQWHKISSVRIVGHSFGGRIGCYLAAHYPALVEQLVLIATSGVPRKRTLKEKSRLFYIRTLRRLAHFIPKPWRQPLIERHRQRFGSADYLNAGELRQTFLNIIHEDFRPLLPNIAAPTLLLWGSEDSETPLDVAHTFAQLIPNNQLIVLPGQDHYPFLNQGVHQCTEILLEFLS